MAKVQYKYRVTPATGYARHKYITRTTEMTLPKNEYGFIKFDTLSELIKVRIAEITAEPFMLLHYVIKGW